MIRFGNNFSGRLLFFFLSGLLLQLGPCTDRVCGQSKVTGQFIFLPDSLRHGHTHGSSIVECPNGDLLACWYEGKTDRSSDVHIEAARWLKGKGRWGDTFLLADTPTLSDNNPCLIVDRTKRLWLFYYTLLGSPEQAWETAYLRYKTSSQYQKQGQPIRWDEEKDLPVRVPDLDETVNKLCAQADRIGADAEEICRQARQHLSIPLDRRLGWTTRARPIFLRSGELVLPMASEIFNVATMAITSDQGHSWTFARSPLGYGVGQPTVFEKNDGTLAVYFRDGSSLHRIRRSESADGGKTWSEIKATDLPNPDSGLEVLRLASGNVVLIYNDVEQDPRCRLAVSLSQDEGKTWPYTRYLENSTTGRFDYPSIIQARDGRLHASYSYNVQTIKHVIFSEAWLLGKN